MSVNEELEKLKEEIEQKKTEQEKALEISKNQSSGISNLTLPTEFSNAIDSAKIHTIKKASEEDVNFNKDFTNELKQAVLKSAQLEKEKQELEKKYIELQQNNIKTRNELEAQKQSVNKWENKRKAREYHYDGLKDIMLFMHIHNPMCIPLMYIFAVIVAPIYFVKTVIISPLVTFITGTKDQERPKLVKGAIYTILCITLIIIIAFLFYACCHYLFKWF